MSLLQFWGSINFDDFQKLSVENEILKIEYGLTQYQQMLSPSFWSFYAAQRAQTSKNIQKPPHSTLWIPGLFWPKIQKEWSAEVKLFSKISKKRQNLAKNHWENSVPLKMGRPNLDTIQPKWIGKLHSKGIMPIFRGSYLTEWKCSRFPCLNLTNFSWICKIS